MGRLNNKGAGVIDMVGYGLSVGVAIGTTVELGVGCACTVALGVAETPVGILVRSTGDVLGVCVSKIGAISVGIAVDAAVHPLNTRKTNDSINNLTIGNPR